MSLVYVCMSVYIMYEEEKTAKNSICFLVCMWYVHIGMCLLVCAYRHVFIGMYVVCGMCVEVCMGVTRSGEMQTASVCLFECVCILYVCMYVYMCMHAFMCACMHACMYVYFLYGFYFEDTGRIWRFDKYACACMHSCLLCLYVCMYVSMACMYAFMCDCNEKTLKASETCM